MRRLAAKMLAWHDDEQAAERLIEMTRDKGGRVRKEALKMLSWIDHSASLAVFEYALADPDRKARGWAQRGSEMAREIKSLVDS